MADITDLIHISKQKKQAKLLARTTAEEQKRILRRQNLSSQSYQRAVSQWRSKPLKERYLTGDKNVTLYQAYKRTWYLEDTGERYKGTTVYLASDGNKYVGKPFSSEILGFGGGALWGKRIINGRIVKLDHYKWERTSTDLGSYSPTTRVNLDYGSTVSRRYIPPIGAMATGRPSTPAQRRRTRLTPQLIRGTLTQEETLLASPILERPSQLSASFYKNNQKAILKQAYQDVGYIPERIIKSDDVKVFIKWYNEQAEKISQKVDKSKILEQKLARDLHKAMKQGNSFTLMPDGSIAIEKNRFNINNQFNKIKKTLKDPIKAFNNVIDRIKDFSKAQAKEIKADWRKSERKVRSDINRLKKLPLSARTKASLNFAYRFTDSLASFSGFKGALKLKYMNNNFVDNAKILYYVKKGKKKDLTNTERADLKISINRVFTESMKKKSLRLLKDKDVHQTLIIGAFMVAGAGAGAIGKLGIAGKTVGISIKTALTGAGITFTGIQVKETIKHPTPENLGVLTFFTLSPLALVFSRASAKKLNLKSANKWKVKIYNKIKNLNKQIKKTKSAKRRQQLRKKVLDLNEYVRDIRTIQKALKTRKPLTEKQIHMKRIQKDRRIMRREISRKAKGRPTEPTARTLTKNQRKQIKIIEKVKKLKIKQEFKEIKRIKKELTDITTKLKSAKSTKTSQAYIKRLVRLKAESVKQNIKLNKLSRLNLRSNIKNKLLFLKNELTIKSVSNRMSNSLRIANNRVIRLNRNVNLAVSRAIKGSKAGIRTIKGKRIVLKFKIEQRQARILAKRKQLRFEQKFNRDLARLIERSKLKFSLRSKIKGNLIRKYRARRQQITEAKFNKELRKLVKKGTISLRQKLRLRLSKKYKARRQQISEVRFNRELRKLIRKEKTKFKVPLKARVKGKLIKRFRGRRQQIIEQKFNRDLRRLSDQERRAKKLRNIVSKIKDYPKDSKARLNDLLFKVKEIRTKAKPSYIKDLIMKKRTVEINYLTRKMLKLTNDLRIYKPKRITARSKRKLAIKRIKEKIIIAKKPRPFRRLRRTKQRAIKQAKQRRRRLLKEIAKTEIREKPILKQIAKPTKRPISKPKLKRPTKRISTARGRQQLLLKRPKLKAKVKPKAKAKAITKQKQRAKNFQEIIQQPRFAKLRSYIQGRRGLALLNVPRLAERYKALSIPVQMSKLKELQEQVTEQEQKERQIQISEQAEQQKELEKQKQKQKQIQIQIEERRQITRRKLKKKEEIPIPKIPKLPKRKYDLLGYGYNVLVKRSGRKGKFSRINSKPLKISHARALARYVVDNTPLASYKLQRANKKATMTFSTKTARKKFRNPRFKSKLPSGTRVEKRKYRIDKLGEKTGITTKGLRKRRTGKAIRKLIRKKIRQKSRKRIRRKPKKKSKTTKRRKSKKHKR